MLLCIALSIQEDLTCVACWKRLSGMWWLTMEMGAKKKKEKKLNFGMVIGMLWFENLYANLLMSTVNISLYKSYSEKYNYLYLSLCDLFRKMLTGLYFIEQHFQTVLHGALTFLHRSLAIACLCINDVHPNSQHTEKTFLQKHKRWTLYLLYRKTFMDVNMNCVSEVNSENIRHHQ